VNAKSVIALASAACYLICAVFWIRAAWAPKPQSGVRMFAVLDDTGHTPQSRVTARDNVIAALFTAAGALLSAVAELMSASMN
jgi:hypothetical protein